MICSRAQASRSGVAIGSVYPGIVHLSNPTCSLAILTKETVRLCSRVVQENQHQGFPKVAASVIASGAKQPPVARPGDCFVANYAPRNDRRLSGSHRLWESPGTNIILV